MKLNRLEYSQFLGSPREWAIEDCTFGDINLIVGKNATGKTRTLSIIKGLGALLSGTPAKPGTKGDELQFSEGKYEATFSKDNEIIIYNLEYHDQAVAIENLVHENSERLTREADGKGKIFAAELNKMISFQTPTNRVAAFAKRDSIQHPFLEDLYAWGRHLVMYEFSTALGRKHLGLFVEHEDELQRQFDPRDTNKVVEIFRRGKSEHSSFAATIIQDMQDIGYNIEDIGLKEPQDIRLAVASDVAAETLGIFVKESDRDGDTFQLAMSQGMFRALSILIQVNYSLLTTEPSCIIIDDIGEGLDFSRSVSLISLVIQKVSGSTSQLIMSTNDRFVMNSVPLEHWIILERRGGRCIHHNFRNAKAMFEDFELTGLSNFDLLSSGYYLKEQSK